MKCLSPICLLFITSLFGHDLDAQTSNYTIDDSFNSGTLLTRGAVSDMLLLEDEKFIVIGQFMAPSVVCCSALFDSNGIMQTNIGVGGQRICRFKNHFLQFGHSLRRFDYQTLISSFKFEFQKSAYNGFLGNEVLGALVEPDDRILAAGRFFTDSTDISPETIRQLCRIDSTGAPDPEFPMLHCAEPVQAFVRDIQQLSDGSMILTGLFTEFGGHAYNQVGKLNPDFSVDTTFVNSFAPGGEGGFIFIDSQDRIWLQMYSSVLIGEAPVFGATLMRLLPDGNVDTDFIRPDLFTPHYAVDIPGTMVDIIEMPDGRFIIVGDFTKVNGQNRQAIALIEEDGALVDGVFENIGPDEAEWGPISNPPVISCIRLLDDGKLLIGGGFSSFGGEPYHCLVRLMPQPVSTTDRENRGTLKLYPNPASNHFRIAQPEGLEPLRQVELWDMQGRMLRTWPAAQSPYPTDGLPAGMYVVRAAGNKGVYTQKLIVPD